MHPYQQAAPQGIGLDAVWRRKGAKGKGVTIVDVEQGWLLKHPQFAHEVDLDHPSTEVQYREHGTGVLGILFGKESNPKPFGIVPKARAVAVSEFYDGSPPDWRPEGAITDAQVWLGAGDILLLEMQSSIDIIGDLEVGHYDVEYAGHSIGIDVSEPVTGTMNTLIPVELDEALREAIGLAAAAGIVVIEPAGNGGASIDRGADTPPTDAIVVGAATWNSTAERYEVSTSSNRGTIVDCYAHADQISTTSVTEAGSPGYGAVGETSGAAAIVAGVCAFLQGIARGRKGGASLTTSALRKVLKSPWGGTPVYETGGATVVGYVPNLKLLTKLLWP